MMIIIFCANIASMATSSHRNSPRGSTNSSRYEATHDRIVEVASRALRRQGYAGVGVADVMKQAGLTHGGFYAHFPSRDALLTEAIARAGADSAAVMNERIAARRAEGVSEFRAIVEHYLSDAHLAGTENGCAVAALASEMPRQSEAVASASCVRVRALVGRVERALASTKADGAAQAFQVVATMVGSLQLARALSSPEQGRAMLAATRTDLLSRFDRPAEAP